MNCCFTDELLVSKYGRSTRLSMFLNVSTYMDDETWLKVVKNLVPGICEAPVSGGWSDGRQPDGVGAPKFACSFFSVHQGPS